LIIFIIHTGNTIHFVKEIYNVIKNQFFYKNKKRHLIMDSSLRNLTKYTSIYTCTNTYVAYITYTVHSIIHFWGEIISFRQIWPKKVSFENLKTTGNIHNLQLVEGSQYLLQVKVELISIYHATGSINKLAPFIITWIILHPLSALLLDEGLNALSVKNPSAAGWYSRLIKCQILACMRISDSLYFRL
jgi:hypothetical protein